MKTITHTSILEYLSSSKKRKVPLPPKYLKIDDSKRIQVKQNFEKLFKAYDLDYFNDLKNLKPIAAKNKNELIKKTIEKNNSNFEIKCLNKSNSSSQSTVISINLSLEASIE